MEKVEYSDIVFLEKMNEIKTTIKNSGFPIDYRKAYETDLKMKGIIERLYNPKHPDKSLVELYDKLNMKIGGVLSYNLVYYYFALYNDNLDILEEVLERGYNFDAETLRENIFIFDKDFSSHFSKEQYLFLIDNCMEELSSFYEKANETFPVNRDHFEERKKLLRELKAINDKLFVEKNNLSAEEKKTYLLRLEEVAQELKNYRAPVYTKEEKEKLYSQFSQIITANPFICKKDNHLEYERDMYPEIISPIMIETLGVERILSLSENEKEILSSIDIRDKELIERVYHLLKKNEGFSKKISLSKYLLSYFTDEEIAHFTDEECKIYEKASLIGEISRVKELKEKGYSFTNKLDLLQPFILSSLTNEDFLSLTQRQERSILRMIHNNYIKKNSSQITNAVRGIARKNRFLQKVKHRFDNKCCI